MKLKIVSTDNELEYIGTNEAGHAITINGNGQGVAPMQSVLIAIATCSSIDIELFLSKMRQSVDRVEVDIEGIRREEVPRIFTDVKIHYTIFGDVKDKKAEQAVEMSMEKYCSVSIMLKDKIDITYTHEVIPKKSSDKE